MTADEFVDIDPLKIPKFTVLIIDEIDDIIEQNPFFISRSGSSKANKYVGAHTAATMLKFHSLIGFTATCMELTTTNFSIDPNCHVLQLHFVDPNQSKLREVKTYS